mmetsp:Transcript_4952/g.11294  ORF Transcript_4952/g.11294 Transcript_4952/m.11294 type:complete len:96 (+) Transcript_4952:100-387(+)
MLPQTAKRFISFGRTMTLRSVKLPPSAVFMNEGERATVDGPDGPIVLTKMGGKVYAVDGICPHMKKSMVDGEIEAGPDGPELKCPFHNSKFCMCA